MVLQPYSFIDSVRYLNVPAFLNYTTNQSGPLTALSGCESVGWIKTKYANQSDDWSDIQFHFAGGSPVSDGGTSILYDNGATNAIWGAYYKPLKNKDTWLVIPIQCCAVPCREGQFV